MAHKNIEEREWKDLQDAGLLWWINRSLHLFGWEIVFEVETDGRIRAFPGRIRAFPAQTRWRGFSEADEEAGFKKLTEHLKSEIDPLVEDVNS